MGETLEKNKGQSGGSQTPTRPRGMAMGGHRGGAPKQETPIVTNILQVVGKTAKTGTSSGKKDDDKTSLKKSTAENQRKYWFQRITELNATINSDLAVLEMMPGTQAEVKQWKERLKQAQSPQQEGRWQDSHKDIATVQAELRKSVAAQGQKKLLDMKSSVKQRKEYETLNAELVEMKKQIEAYPDGDTLAKPFAEDARKGTEYYAADQYALALESMKKAHATAKSTLKDWDGRYSDSRSLVSPFKDVSNKLDALIELIDDKEEVVGNAVVEPFRKRTLALQKEVLDALEGGNAIGPTKKRDQQNTKSKDVSGRTDTLKLELQNAVKEAEDQRGKAEQWVMSLQQKVADAAEVQAASTVQGAYQSLQQIRNKIGERDYAEALTLCKTLAEEVKGWPTLPPPGDSRFAAVQKAAKDKFLDPALKQLERAKQLLADAKQAAVLNTAPTAASIVELLDTQIVKYRGNVAAYPVGEGLDTVARATKANDTNEQRKKDYLALAKIRDGFKRQIDELVKTIDGRLATLKQNLAGSGGDITRLPTYEDARDSALQQWTDGAESATTEKQLPFAAVKTQLEQLRDKIEADAKDADVLKARGIEGRFATLTKAFEAANTTATKAVETLTETSYEEGDTQLGKLVAARNAFFAAVKKHDADAAQAAVDAIAAVTVTADTATKTAASEFEKAKAAWFKESGPVNDELRKLGERLKNKKLAAYAGVLKALASEKQTMFIVAQESNDAGVLTALLRDLQELKAEIAKVKSIFDKVDAKTPPAPGDVTIDSLKKRAEVLTKAFGDKAIKKMEPEALKALVAKCETIVAAIGTVKLCDSDQQLKELAQEWADLQKKVQLHETAITNFLADVDKVTLDLANTGIATQYFDYAAALDKRLKALAANAKEGREDKEALADLKKEIAETVIHNGALAVANDKAQIAELAELAAAKKWASDYAAFQGRLQALKIVRKSIADPEKKKAFDSQADQIVDASKALAKSEGKTPYATMNEQLQALMTNINNLIAYPMGMETHARGQVMETIKAFNAAVTDFHKKVDTMLKTVVTEVNGATMTPDLKQAAIKAVSERVAKEKALLAINTITPMAAKMLKAGDDIDAARDAREEAMREVKRLQRVVEGAPLKALASKNPFDKTLLDALRNLSANLFNVETNLTISL